jgi:hypothetical protein
VGPRGASLSIGKRGVYGNISPGILGINGTGLFFRQKLFSNTSSKKATYGIMSSRDRIPSGTYGIFGYSTLDHWNPIIKIFNIPKEELNLPEFETEEFFPYEKGILIDDPKGDTRSSIIKQLKGLGVLDKEYNTSDYEFILTENGNVLINSVTDFSDNDDIKETSIILENIDNNPDMTRR